jgi:hypothetical protein
MWVTSIMSWKPKVPLEPFIEWAALNKALTSSGSGAPGSIASSNASMLARCSAASSKKHLIELAHVYGHACLP